MKKAKVNLNDITIKDLNDQVYQTDLLKVLPNLIYMDRSCTIELADIAKGLNKGQEVEVSKEELEHIISILSAKQVYLPFIHFQILDYFNSLNK